MINADVVARLLMLLLGYGGRDEYDRGSYGARGGYDRDYDERDRFGPRRGWDDGMLCYNTSRRPVSCHGRLRP